MPTYRAWDLKKKRFVKTRVSGYGKSLRVKSSSKGRASRMKKTYATLATFKQPGKIIADRVRTTLNYVDAIPERTAGAVVDYYTFNLNR